MILEESNEFVASIDKVADDAWFGASGCKTPAMRRTSVDASEPENEAASRIAWRILGEIEEAMNDDGVAVHSSDPSDRVKVKAFFDDEAYQTLEKAIVQILVESGDANCRAAADRQWARSGEARR